MCVSLLCACVSRCGLWPGIHRGGRACGQITLCLMLAVCSWHISDSPPQLCSFLMSGTARVVLRGGVFTFAAGVASHWPWPRFEARAFAKFASLRLLLLLVAPTNFLSLLLSLPVLRTRPVSNLYSWTWSVYTNIASLVVHTLAMYVVRGFLPLLGRVP